MIAWLITWEWTSYVDAVADRVAAILNPHWGERRVAPFVEFLYANTNATVRELAFYAKKPNNNPYLAVISSFSIVRCGHNPFLFARKVSELFVTVDADTGLETIKWMEPPSFSIVNGKVEMIRKPEPDKFTRRIIGHVLNDPIWDRSARRFREGWGPGELPPERPW